jgi:hypothetical protein
MDQFAAAYMSRVGGGGGVAAAAAGAAAAGAAAGGTKKKGKGAWHKAVKMMGMTSSTKTSEK